jgi:NAD+ kinase|tara:strand:+ start:16922 stop:17791 length:870 start_codon:yes stop_codon:yes gene_type:complete
MFKSIGIIGFVDNLLVRETVNRLIKYLEDSGLDFFVEDDTRDLSNLPEDKHSCSRAEMGKSCDLVVVVGGDGSMLHAARDMVDFKVPLLGINRGRLGFLTDIPPTELEQEVGEVLKGNFVTSNRFMLECELIREGKIVDTGIALNDIVLQPRDSIRMIEFSLGINEQYVYTLRSDGLIVSTPTGSTAYALSGGGPIVHPAINAINIVPINPHTLSNRPIIVDGDSELEIAISEHNSINAQIVCDGQNHILGNLGDKVRIRKKQTEIKLIHPSAHSFYETCRSKLHWAQD